MRRLAAVLAAAILTTGIPLGGTLAGASGAATVPANHQPLADETPICDVKVSVDGGPLTDGPVTIRSGQLLTAYGTGYPPSIIVHIVYEDWIQQWMQVTTSAEGTFTWTTRNGYATDHEPDTNVLIWFDPDNPEECSDSVSFEILRSTPFVDIWASPFDWEITWVYQHGITAGCTETEFCPKNPVTREQMASFLVRALKLPPTDQDFFTDDEASMHQDSINRLAASGITAGCTETAFCPKDTVTRAQMASFLARGFELAATDTDYFVDDNGNMHEGTINALAASGITGGCARNPDRYCPALSVTREQMAAFLARAFISWH